MGEVQDDPSVDRRSLQPLRGSESLVSQCAFLEWPADPADLGDRHHHRTFGDSLSGASAKAAWYNPGVTL